MAGEKSKGGTTGGIRRRGKFDSPIFKLFLRNRLMAEMVKRGASRAEAREHLREIDDEVLLDVVEQSDLEEPSQKVGGPFLDWLQTVDLTKLIDLILKIIGMFDDDTARTGTQK